MLPVSLSTYPCTAVAGLDYPSVSALRRTSLHRFAGDLPRPFVSLTACHFPFPKRMGNSKLGVTWKNPSLTMPTNFIRDIGIVGNAATLAAPLIEVFSISIGLKDHRRTFYQKKRKDIRRTDDIIKVYGDITITDGEGATFHLYSREKNNPETVTIGQPLSLTFLEKRAISPRGVVVVDVHLMDETRDVLIAKGWRKWDYRVKNDYEETQTQLFRGFDGFSAALKYITYRCAVIGNVKVTLCKESDDVNRLDAQVYGSIVAYCVNKYQCNDAREGIVLFDVPQNECVRMEYGTAIPLSRTVAVVPAYCYLVIHAKLKDRITDSNIVCDWIGLDSYEILNSREKKGLVDVEINWTHPYLEPWVPSEQAPPTFFSSEWTSQGNSRSIERESYEKSVVEIFSVFVGDKISKLFGIITATDNFYRDKFMIYKREKHSPEELSYNNKISSIGISGPPRIITGDNIFIDVNLKDGKGRKVCDGIEGWRNDVKDHVFGKRLCAVFTDRYGYAAMHYMVFPAGLPAMVCAKVFAPGSSSDVRFNIFGMIVSEYGDYKCLTRYDKEYYRSRLFVRPATNPLKGLASESMISLLKDAVAVPKRSSLIIHADLHVEVPGEGIIDRVHGIQEFEAGGDQIVLKNFEGQQFYIQVTVEWGEVRTSVHSY